jgi:mRNA interferase ChpB
MNNYIPKRGDIIKLSFDPALGTEQQGYRPALVLSPYEFNRAGGALVCPITQGGSNARLNHWAVTLMGTGTETQGVILCNQSRTIDHRIRQARFVEAVPTALVDEVIARVSTLLE